MKILPASILLLVSALAGYARAEQDDPSQLAARLQQRLDIFHAEAHGNGEKLHLVYFHPGDTQPQKDYRERVSRIISDVREFYASEMARNGFSTPELPLDMANGRPVIHLVAGEQGSDAYTYENSTIVRRDIEAALQGKIDFASDFILVFGGMCRKRGENNYLFHAPYYGDGRSNHQRGLCYAADCELLDPENLTDTKNFIVFEEHYYKELRMTVAKFNSWYLGGIAHELGHGLSLPHNGEWPEESAVRGRALMGHGNHSYRNAVWGGGRGSFMTPATCARLAAHPLFTGSDRGRDIVPESEFTSLDFTSKEGVLTINGTIEAGIEPLAVIAYTNPGGGSSYDSKPWLAEVVDGAFTVAALRHEAGPHVLDLTVLYMNGATTKTSFRYNVFPPGVPDADALAARRIVSPIEKMFMDGRRDAAVASARKMLRSDPGSLATPQLRHLIALATEPRIARLAEVTASAASLSDVHWEKASLGWARPVRNRFYHNPNYQKGVLLELGGVFFEKGLYAHADSRFTFDLNGQWKTFEATVGLQPGAFGSASAVFSVVGDGKTLIESEKLDGMRVEKFSVDVKGVRTLELVAKSAGKNNNGCWAIWGAPIVRR